LADDERSAITQLRDRHAKLMSGIGQRDRLGISG
jgi:hypothetical protein